MKRLLVLVLACLLLCGCSTQTEPIQAAESAPIATVVPTPEATTEPTASPTPTPRPDDFFTDADRKNSYSDALEKQDYASIVALAQAYIDANPSISANDSAHKIIEIAGESAEAIKNCDIVYDDFTEETTVYFKKMREIDKKLNVVPFYSGSDYSLRVGFLDRDCIFTEEVDIKLDTGAMITNALSYDDLVTDFRGSRTLEYADIGLSDADVAEIEGAQSATVRFIGDDGETIDKEITSTQLYAVSTLYRLSRSYVELSNLCYRWNQDMPATSIQEGSAEVSSSDSVEENTDIGTAMGMVKALVGMGADITKIIEYDEDTDPNELLGRPNSYTEKVNFTFNGKYEGTVEVFLTEDDAKARAAYIEELSALNPSFGYYVYPHGLNVFRLEYSVKPSDAEGFAKLLDQMFEA